MHPSAMKNGQAFFETYVSRLNQATVVEIGSQDVNGSLRDVAPNNVNYIGLDFEEAKGVDVLLTDPYALPFEKETVDVVVSSSCFEHSEMFWLVFTEILRILKPNGLFYLNVPSNGVFHRYPVDCWRFYPDAGEALATWGRRCGYPTALLESYTSPQESGMWNDFVAVFLKDESHIAEHPFRIASENAALENTKIWGEQTILHETSRPEDMRRIKQLNELLTKEQRNSALQKKALTEAGEQLHRTQAELAIAHQENTKASIQNKNLNSQIKSLNDQVIGLEVQIDALRNSRSWKLTAPLRVVKDTLRRP